MKELSLHTLNTCISHAPTCSPHFVSPPNVIPPSDPETVEQDDWLTSTVGDTSTPESSNTIFKIPADKIQEYVMKELKLKLDRGHSVTDIEGHLNNAASLMGGDQISMTWSDVLKMMRKLGYVNPHYYKVRAGHDHSFLLKSKEENPACALMSSDAYKCLIVLILPPRILAFVLPRILPKLGSLGSSLG